MKTVAEFLGSLIVALIAAAALVAAALFALGQQDARAQVSNYTVEIPGGLCYLATPGDNFRICAPASWEAGGVYTIDDHPAGGSFCYTFRPVDTAAEGDFELGFCHEAEPDGPADHGWTRPMPLTLYYNPTGASVELEGAIVGAIALWNATPAKVELVYGGTTSATTFVTDGIDVIGWGQADTPGELGGAINTASECDVRMNKLIDWTKRSAQRVLLHELGHCLGLGHTDGVMAGLYSSMADAPTPSDVGRLVTKYGQRSYTVAVPGASTQLQEATPEPSATPTQLSSSDSVEATPTAIAYKGVISVPKSPTPRPPATGSGTESEGEYAQPAAGEGGSEAWLFVAIGLGASAFFATGIAASRSRS